MLSIAAQGTDYYAPGGTDVALADGGTGASDATGARANLGLTTVATTTPGTGVLSALASAVNGAGGFLTDGAIGTDAQAYDADLTTYAAITPSADVQGILAAADFDAILTLLGLGDIIDLADPGNDAFAFWDESDNAMEYAFLGTGLSHNGTSSTVELDADLVSLATPGAGVVTAATAATNASGGFPTIGKVTAADAATLTPTGDHAINRAAHTAQAQALTIAAPSGTAADQNTLAISITATGGDRALTWNGIYEDGADLGALPATAVSGKTLRLVFEYDNGQTKWKRMAEAEEP